MSKNLEEQKMMIEMARVALAYCAGNSQIFELQAGRHPSRRSSL